MLALLTLRPAGYQTKICDLRIQIIVLFIVFMDPVPPTPAAGNPLD